LNPARPQFCPPVFSWSGGAPTDRRFRIAVCSLQASAPQASAHYCVDDQDVIQCVLECDVAWHAPGANSNGIGIEHAGYASQTPEQWDDNYSRAVLANSAKLVAGLCKRFNVPMVRLSVAELAAGGRGLCGHVDCTNAFSHGSGHQDPGVNFPWAAYVALVTTASGLPSP